MGSEKVVVSTASMAPKSISCEKSCFPPWEAWLPLPPTFLMAWPGPLAAKDRAPLQKPPSR